MRSKRVLLEFPLPGHYARTHLPRSGVSTAKKPTSTMRDALHLRHVEVRLIRKVTGVLT